METQLELPEMPQLPEEEVIKLARPGVTITTASMWRMFCDCRRKVLYRHIKKLSPIKRNKNFVFGSVIHDALCKWHATNDMQLVKNIIDASLEDRDFNDARGHKQRTMWNVAHVMMEEYAKFYATENFTPIGLEIPFEFPIYNPDTWHVSRSMRFAGKMDGIVRVNDAYYVFEHKTATSVDNGYFAKLPRDLQISLYTIYAEYLSLLPGGKKLPRMAGCLYNVLLKPSQTQGTEESVEDFTIRYNALCAKNKGGTSTATRKLAESDTDFRARVRADFYADPSTKFLRQEVPISPRNRAEIIRKLWVLTKQFLAARNEKDGSQWYTNTGSCFLYNSECPYFKLCSSNDSQVIMDTEYEIVEPNQELSSENVEISVSGDETGGSAEWGGLAF